MNWVRLHPKASIEMLGLIPEFLNPNDPRPAKEQLDSNYQHGGGWSPMKGFKLDRVTLELLYPEDLPTKPLACTWLRDEQVVVYEHAWVAIIQEDGSFEVARMD